MARAEYQVVVTGFGHFADEGVNSARLVRDALPDRIEREGKTPIRLIKYPFNFRNVWTDLDYVPPLWSQKKSVYYSEASKDDTLYIDAMLHIGMRPHSPGYALEQRARRDGYTWVGDDGVQLPEHNGGECGMFKGEPAELHPMFDVDAAIKQLQKQRPDLELEASTEAGLMYCEFLFYYSLVTLHRRQESARAMFLHVPGDDEKKDIKNGVEIAEATICAMVDAISK